MGSLGNNKTKTTASTTGNATTTPQVPGFIQQPVSDYFGQVGGVMNGGSQPWTPGRNANLNSAFTGAQNLGQNTGIADAQDATRGLFDYAPDDVANEDAYGLMGNYTNPWEEGVVQSALADIERSRAGAISVGQGNATQAGAFGGSRHGVSDSLTNEAAMRAAGSTAGALRSAGFNTALGAAQFDASGRNAANQFNVNSGMQGANLRLNAANQMGLLGASQDANTRANLATQAGLGAAEQENDQANDPNEALMRRLSQLQSLLGLNPAALIGQNVESNGTQTGTTSQSGGLGWLGALGSLFGGLGSLGVGVGGKG